MYKRNVSSSSIWRMLILFLILSWPASLDADIYSWHADPPPSGGTITSPSADGAVYLCGSKVEFTCDRGTDCDTFQHESYTPYYNTCTDPWPADDEVMHPDWPEWRCSDGDWFEGKNRGMTVYWVAPDYYASDVNISMYENDLPTTMASFWDSKSGGSRDDEPPAWQDTKHIKAIVPELDRVTYGAIPPEAKISCDEPEWERSPAKNMEVCWLMGSQATAEPEFWYSESLTAAPGNVVIRGETSNDDDNIGDWLDAGTSWGTTWPQPSGLVCEARKNMKDMLQTCTYETQWRYRCPDAEEGTINWIDILPKQTDLIFHVVDGTPPGPFNLEADLDVDSDNGAGFGLPVENDPEDAIEDDSGKPGKIVVINDDDDDGDGIPDFADGFDAWAGGGVIGEKFVPLCLAVSIDTLPDCACFRVRFTYDDSNPNGAGGVYIPPAGAIRIWTKDGHRARKSASVSKRGDFVVSGEEYNLTQLGFLKDETTGEIDDRKTFYIEAINPSAGLGYTRILVEFEYDEDGDGTYEVISEDAVRVTAMKVDLDIYNGATNVVPGNEIQVPDPYGPEDYEYNLGAYLLVNCDDDNGNGTPDLSETGIVTIPQEDDLSKITLSWGGVNVGTLELINSNSNIKIWEERTKFVEQGMLSWNLASTSPPTELWLEGTGPSTAERGVELELRWTAPGGIVASDKVRATAVEIRLGNAVYREMALWDWLVDTDRGHCALVTEYIGICNRDDFFNANNFEITEMQMIPDRPVRDILPSITNNGALAPFGCYTNEGITYSQRLKILASAQVIYDERRAFIHYDWYTALLPNNWNDTINGIALMRCDGLVEVCYEIHDLDVWGKIVGVSKHYNIKNNTYQEEHNDFDYPDVLIDPLRDRYDIWGDTLMPATQSGHAVPFDATTTFSKQDLCYPIGHKGGN